MKFNTSVDDMVGIAKTFDTEVTHKDTQAHNGVTIIFADLVGSSEAGSTMPDDYSKRNVFIHNQTLIKIFEEAGGELVKEIGDEVMIAITGENSQKKAILCSKHAMSLFKEYNKLSKIVKYRKHHIRSKIAIHHLDTVIKYNKDYLGHGVDVAARIASISSAGQIVISNEVFNHIKDEGKLIKEICGPYYCGNLKNIPAQILYEVNWNNSTLGINNNKIQSLVLIDLKQTEGQSAGDKTLPILSMENLKGTFSHAKLKNKILYGGVILGSKKLLLRMQAHDLQDHKELMKIIMKLGSEVYDVPFYNHFASMTSTYFIYNSQLPTQKDSPTPPPTLPRDPKSKYKAGLFMMISLDNTNLNEFMKTIRDVINKTNGLIIDAGLIFGEKEAFVVFQANNKDEKYKFIFGSELGGVTIQSSEVFALYDLRKFDTIEK